jgi:hypothetical protein
MLCMAAVLLSPPAAACLCDCFDSPFECLKAISGDEYSHPQTCNAGMQVQVLLQYNAAAVMLCVTAVFLSPPPAACLCDCIDCPS